MSDRGQGRGRGRGRGRGGGNKKGGRGQRPGRPGESSFGDRDHHRTRPLNEGPRPGSRGGNQQGPKPHQQEAQPSRGGQQSGRNTGEQSKIQPYHDSGRRPAEPHIPDDRYSLTPAEQPPGIRPGPQPRRPEGRKSAWATLPPPTGATPTPLVPTLPVSTPLVPTLPVSTPPVSTPPVPTPPVPTSSTRTQPPGPPHYTPTTDSPLNGATLGEKPGPLALPPRPGFGKSGRPIRLRTNFFKVKIPSNMTLFHYDVEIQPKIPRKLKRKVMQEAIRQNSKLFSGQLPVFDGEKTMYCHKKLPEGKIQLPSVSWKEGEKEKTFKVEVKYTGHMMQLDDLETVMGDPGQRMDIIQALDLVLSQSVSLKPEVVSVGRSFFTPTRGRTMELGDGREVWYGYHQSLRPSMWKTMLLNIDIAATAFYKEQPVLDFMKEVMGRDFDPRRPLQDFMRRKFAKEIKGLKIKVTHLSYPRQYKVNDITTKSVSQLTFPLDGKDCTVEKYFMEKYSIRLQFPHLPCLHVGAKEKHIYIPLEYCKIAPGQRCIKKLTDMQTGKMIRFTAKRPDEREQYIEEKVDSARFDEDPYLKEYGLSVSNEMETVSGRVLPAPAIQYQGRRTVDPRNGAWDMKNLKFWSGVSIDYWAVAVCNDSQRVMREDQLWKFISRLMDHSSRLGMAIRHEPVVVYQKRREAPKDMFDSLRRENPNLQLIMAVLPKKGAGSGYAEVKRAGDNQLGVCTQCVVTNTVSRADYSTLTNMCLKINAKLGGTNNTTISRSRILQEKPVIVMGADVTHPAPSEQKKPSIAALVASMDIDATLYRADTRVQERRKEIITELKEMVKGMMRAFWRSNHGTRPERIIFYRDGVSEGQFQAVLENELQALQKACNELERGYQPGITFIVVQKRHHTKFFPMDDRDKMGKSGNVPPGTTVDKGITHPTDHDFYLCSHAGIQGTSKPCHYYVLYDDNKFSADDMQALAYQLCHVFFRCNRSVSYPAPAYYAHLAAFRARYLLQDWEDKSSDSASSVSSQSDTQWSKAEMADAIRIKEVIQQTGMYFA